MTDADSQPLPDWIGEILDRWIPPEDYDARLSAVVDGYIADQVGAVNPQVLPDPACRRDLDGDDLWGLPVVPCRR